MMLICPSKDCKYWTKEDGCEYDGEITINPADWTEIRCKQGYTPKYTKQRIIDDRGY